VREDRGQGDTPTSRPGSVPGRSAPRLSHALRCVAVLAVHPHTLATTTRSTRHARQPLVTSMAVAATATHPQPRCCRSGQAGTGRRGGGRPVWRVGTPTVVDTVTGRSAVSGGPRCPVGRSRGRTRRWPHSLTGSPGSLLWPRRRSGGCDTTVSGSASTAAARTFGIACGLRSGNYYRVTGVVRSWHARAGPAGG